jgi:hypothetical protein
MTPGHATADLLFGFILSGTAPAAYVATEIDADELRRALAALSTFRGPGTFARDVTIQLISDEIDRRAA